MVKFLVDNDDNTLLNVDHISRIYIQKTSLDGNERFQIIAEVNNYAFVLTTAETRSIIKERFWEFFNNLNSSDTLE